MSVCVCVCIILCSLGPCVGQMLFLCAMHIVLTSLCLLRTDHQVHGACWPLCVWVRSIVLVLPHSITGKKC